MYPGLRRSSSLTLATGLSNSACSDSARSGALTKIAHKKATALSTYVHRQQPISGHNATGVAYGICTATRELPICGADTLIITLSNFDCRCIECPTTQCMACGPGPHDAQVTTHHPYHHIWAVCDERHSSLSRLDLARMVKSAVFIPPT